MAEAIFTGTSGILCLALILDALVGDPPRVWDRVPHPVVLFGRAIDWGERQLNDPSLSGVERRRKGVLLLVILLAGAAAIGWLLHRAVEGFPYGWLLEAAIASVFLAQRSL